MSYSSNLLANKTAFNTDVTTKATPSSITPSNVGGNAEDLIDTIITGDIDAIVSLGRYVNNQTISFKDGSGVICTNVAPQIVKVFSPDGLESIKLAADNGSGNTYIEISRNSNLIAIDASLITANRLQKFPNRSGTYQLSGDLVNPTFTLGGGAGAGATASFSAQSDDRKGEITINTGVGCTSSDVIIRITYTQPYSFKTVACISAANPISALHFNRFFIGIDASTSFLIEAAGTALSDSTTYILKYIVAN